MSCRNVVIVDNFWVVRVVTVMMPFLTTQFGPKGCQFNPGNLTTLPTLLPKSCQWVVTVTVFFLKTLEAKVVIIVTTFWLSSPTTLTTF